jgi:hypothetical protein
LEPDDVNVYVHAGTVPAVIASAEHRVVDVDVSVKVTVPVGLAVPEKAGVRVAVKVTCALTADGLGVDTRVVVVAVALTT